MIPVAQLDPATLTLWYSPEVIGHAPEPEMLGEAVWLAMKGEPDAVRQHLGEVTDPHRKARGVHLASSVWHEQRHMLDLLVTNYGAFRVRQFISLYTNVLQLLGEVQRTGQVLFCPITAYTDP